MRLLTNNGKFDKRQKAYYVAAMYTEDQAQRFFHKFINEIAGGQMYTAQVLGCIVYPSLFTYTICYGSYSITYHFTNQTLANAFASKFNRNLKLNNLLKESLF
jgi:hypothetical protein